MKTAVKHHIALTLIFTILVISAFSCSKKPGIADPVDDKSEQQYEPGKRDYTWTVDTLYMPMNYIKGLWGASPDDIWACGPGGGPPEWLQHYDGKKWSAYSEQLVTCAGNTIYGFAKNDVKNKMKS